MASRRRWLERQEEEVAVQERRPDEWQNFEYQGVVAKAPPCPQMTLRTPLPAAPATKARRQPEKEAIGY